MKVLLLERCRQLRSELLKKAMDDVQLVRIENDLQTEIKAIDERIAAEATLRSPIGKPPPTNRRVRNRPLRRPRGGRFTQR